VRATNPVASHRGPRGAKIDQGACAANENAGPTFHPGGRGPRRRFCGFSDTSVMKHMKRLLSRIDSALAPTVEMFERPFTNARRRRPSRPLANSRLGPARQIARAVLAFEFAWRLLASRLPVMRVSLQAAVVHPQFYAAKNPHHSWAARPL
jgi:hypothetical protein